MSRDPQRTNDDTNKKIIEKLSKTFLHVERKGFYGEIMLRAKLEDGVIQMSEVHVTEVEKF